MWYYVYVVGDEPQRSKNRILAKELDQMDIKTFNLVAGNLPAEIAVLMRGPTGVGKSHLVQEWIAAMPGRKIYLTAPTHEAAGTASSQQAEPLVEFDVATGAVTLRKGHNKFESNSI